MPHGVSNLRIHSRYRAHEPSADKVQGHHKCVPHFGQRHQRGSFAGKPNQGEHQPSNRRADLSCAKSVLLRRDHRAQRFGMDFAFSAADALVRIANFGDASLVLILSDINMPGMTGLDMLPKVREMRPDVPVIRITAYGDVETRRKAMERGAVGLLTKPIDFTVLREEIDARLERAA